MQRSVQNKKSKWDIPYQKDRDTSYIISVLVAERTLSNPIQSKGCSGKKRRVVCFIKWFFVKPKKTIPNDVIQYLKDEYLDKKVICPECGDHMVKVPMSFETPPEKNIKEWKILQSFYEATG